MFVKTVWDQGRMLRGEEVCPHYHHHHHRRHRRYHRNHHPHHQRQKSIEVHLNGVLILVWD